MLIQEIDFNQLPEITKPLFDKIYQREVSGYVIHHFFSGQQVQQAKEIFTQATVAVNQPFEGYYALPRPFNFLELENPAAYHAECNDFQRITEQTGLFSSFQQRLQKLAPETTIHYATPGQNISLSKAWASIRELQVDKGKFELHCGRLFRQFNSEFYDHFAGRAEVERQLSFFVLIQKPLTDCDIEIYDVHWDEFEQRVGEHEVKSHAGEVVDVRTRPSYKVNMGEGDMLLFDGAHYWHQVPGFSGEKSRFTFGGFITKFKDGRQVMVWA